LPEFPGVPERYDGFLVFDPCRPQLQPFLVVPEDVNAILSICNFQVIVKLGSARFTEIKVLGRGDGRATGRIFGVEMNAAHGAFKMA
jgi:hypothetical protein